MKIGKVSVLLLATLLMGSLSACPTFSRPPIGILTAGHGFWSRGDTLVILGNGRVETAMEIRVQRPNEKPRTYPAGAVFAVWDKVIILTPGYVRLKVID